LSRVSSQLDLGLDLDSDRQGHELDTWLDPAMQHSHVTWDDIDVPSWLRDLAQDAWDQLNALVDDPHDKQAVTRMDGLRAAYDSRYAEAIAVSLDEARHRERRGARQSAAKVRDKLRNKMAKSSDAAPAGGVGSPELPATSGTPAGPRGLVARVTGAVRGRP
jgi:hypothetical protein